MRTACAVLLGLSVALEPGWVAAEPTNGVVTLLQDTIASSSGQVGGNPIQALTTAGEVGSGTVSHATCTVYLGYQGTPVRLPPGTKTIAVVGAINEQPARVDVNSVTATLTAPSQGGTAWTFRAEGIQLTEGPNTITATATDLAGNTAQQRIVVQLDTRPPARPTIADAPAVTTAASYTLTGTKTPGTSVWINGVQVVPLGDATAWSHTTPLVEGDNVFVVVTKDDAGNESASNTINIVVDNLPPVITVTLPAKTNLNPFPLTGAVDDSLTRVVVNTLTAQRAGKTFTVNVPLTEGANTLTITATSPNGYVTTKTLTITLGTIPTITAVQPPDGTKFYVGTMVACQIRATDRENDPIEYQILLDGQVLMDWSAANTATWTPGVSHLGLRTIELRARDAYGGYQSQSVELFVLRNPVPPS